MCSTSCQGAAKMFILFPSGIFFFFMFGSVMPMNIADQNAVCSGRKLKVSNLEHE